MALNCILILDVDPNIHYTNGRICRLCVCMDTHYSCYKTVVLFLFHLNFHLAEIENFPESPDVFSLNLDLPREDKNLMHDLHWSIVHIY